MEQSNHERPITFVCSLLQRRPPFFTQRRGSSAFMTRDKESTEIVDVDRPRIGWACIGRERIRIDTPRGLEEQTFK